MLATASLGCGLLAASSRERSGVTAPVLGSVVALMRRDPTRPGSSAQKRRP